jgi:hypothetical protein
LFGYTSVVDIVSTIGQLTQQISVNRNGTYGRIDAVVGPDIETLREITGVWIPSPVGETS